jgi:hypothetical protein
VLNNPRIIAAINKCILKHPIPETKPIIINDIEIINNPIPTSIVENIEKEAVVKKPRKPRIKKPKKPKIIKVKLPPKPKPIVISPEILKKEKIKNIFDKSYFGKVIKKISINNMARNTTYTHEDSKGLHEYDVVYSLCKIPHDEVTIESVSENGLEVNAADDLIILIKQKIINNQDSHEVDDNFRHGYENLD